MDVNPGNNEPPMETFEHGVMERDQHRQYYVYLKRNATIIGLVEWVDYPWERASSFVVNLEVKKKYRLQGRGRRLMAYMARLLVNRRIWNVVLDNCADAGNTFYEALGFIYSSDMDNEMRIKTCQLL